jgi:hypothetical protein
MSTGVVRYPLDKWSSFHNSEVCNLSWELEQEKKRRIFMGQLEGLFSFTFTCGLLLASSDFVLWKWDQRLCIQISAHTHTHTHIHTHTHTHTHNRTKLDCICICMLAFLWNVRLRLVVHCLTRVSVCIQLYSGLHLRGCWVLSHPLSLSLSHTNTFKGRGEPYILTKEREGSNSLRLKELLLLISHARWAQYFTCLE